MIGPIPTTATACSVLADGSVFEGELFGAAGGAQRARSCSTRRCRATRRSSPTRATPGRSSRSPTRTSATTASTPPTSSPAGRSAAGVVVRELSRRPSNRRSRGRPRRDARALRHPRHHRHRHPPPDPADPRHRRHPRRLRAGRRRSTRSRAAAAAEPGTDGIDLVATVTTPEPYTVGGGGPFRIVAYDFGIKRTILRHLAGLGTVEVVPASTPAADVLAREPDGVFLSNGPGDPAEVPYAVDGDPPSCSARCPIFGICLGHQLLGRAARRRRRSSCRSATTAPTTRSRTSRPGRIEITSQNHNFAVDADTLPAGRRAHPRQPQRRRVRGAGRSPTPARSPCSTTPRPAPVRTTAPTCSTASPAMAWRDRTRRAADATGEPAGCRTGAGVPDAARDDIHRSSSSGPGRSSSARPASSTTPARRRAACCARRATASSSPTPTRRRS